MNRAIVIPYGALRNACLKHQLTARLYIFDGGETVEITDDANGGTQLLRETALHGDDHSASEGAAKWLMENGYLTMFDFEG
jgi:hypothetical protein